MKLIVTISVIWRQAAFNQSRLNGMGDGDNISPHLMWMMCLREPKAL